VVFRQCPSRAITLGQAFIWEDSKEKKFFRERIILNEERGRGSIELANYYSVSIKHFHLSKLSTPLCQ
jgi:hypothetical protein